MDSGGTIACSGLKTGLKKQFFFCFKRLTAFERDLIDQHLVDCVGRSESRQWGICDPIDDDVRCGKLV